MQRIEEILSQKAYAPDISVIKLFMDSVDQSILFPTPPPLHKQRSKYLGWRTQYGQLHLAMKPVIERKPTEIARVEMELVTQNKAMGTLVFLLSE